MLGTVPGDEDVSLSRLPVLLLQCGRTGRYSPGAEPAISQGAPRVVPHDAADCVELTDELLGRVFEQIVAWYDVVEALLIA
jgi:hypothetical protein